MNAAPPIDTSLTTPLVSTIFSTSIVAHIEDEEARTTQRYLEGTIANKAELENLLSTTLVYPGVNKKAMRQIALGEFVDFNKLTVDSLSSGESNNNLAIENGTLAVTTQLQPVPIRTFADLQYAFNLWSGATCLIYPNREKELRTYGNMLLEMVRKDKASIHRVIEFDILVRRTIAHDKHLKLTSDFGLLRQSHFSTPGSFISSTHNGDAPASRKTSSAKKRPSSNDQDIPRSEQICEKHLKGLCKTNPCEHGRKHILKCSKCKGLGHLARDCTSGSNESDKSE